MVESSRLLGDFVQIELSLHDDKPAIDGVLHKGRWLDGDPIDIVRNLRVAADRRLVLHRHD